MNSKDNNAWFFKFSSAMLLLTATAKVYSSTGSVKLLHAQDQLLHLGYRQILISAAFIEVAMAIFLFRDGDDLKRARALLWLSTNFLFYHFGNYLMGYHNCPCLGHLADQLPLPQGLADVVLKLLVLYWLLNSINILWRNWGAEQWARLPWASRKEVAAAAPM